jgi:hypothetical protein
MLSSLVTENIIISGSTVLVRTLAASHQRFVNLIKTHVRNPRMCNQPVTKASIYAGQHNTETPRQISMPRAGFEPTIQSNQAAKTSALDRAATGTGSY